MAKAKAKAKQSSKSRAKAKPAAKARPKPVPVGYHTVTPHLVVRDGNKAIDFYKAAFGAKELMRMPGPGGAIMHAELKVGDSRIMLADEWPQGPKSASSLGGSPVVVSLYVTNADAVYERAVKAGAKVLMPLGDAFWGDRYGQVQDPFGHIWSVATHKEDVTPKEMARRAAAFMAQPPPQQH